MSSSGDGGWLIPIGITSGGKRAIDSFNDLPRSLQVLAGLPPAAVAAVIAFANDPVGFIVEVVAAFVVATLLELGAIVVGTVDTVAATVAAVPRFVRLLFSGAFAQAGALLIGGIADLVRGVATAAQAAGPAGPVLIAVTLALTLVAVYRVSVALIGEVPGGSSLVDIFNLR